VPQILTDIAFDQLPSDTASQVIKLQHS